MNNGCICLHRPRLQCRTTSDVSSFKGCTCCLKATVSARGNWKETRKQAGLHRQEPPKDLLKEGFEACRA